MKKYIICAFLVSFAPICQIEAAWGKKTKAAGMEETSSGWNWPWAKKDKNEKKKNMKKKPMQEEPAILINENQNQPVIKR